MKRATVVTAVIVPFVPLLLIGMRSRVGGRSVCGRDTRASIPPIGLGRVTLAASCRRRLAAIFPWAQQISPGDTPPDRSSCPDQATGFRQRLHPSDPFQGSAIQWGSAPCFVGAPVRPGMDRRLWPQLKRGPRTHHLGPRARHRGIAKSSADDIRLPSHLSGLSAQTTFGETAANGRTCPSGRLSHTGSYRPIADLGAGCRERQLRTLSGRSAGRPAIETQPKRV